jgi:hypothetical protein
MEAIPTVKLELLCKAFHSKVCHRFGIFSEDFFQIKSKVSSRFNKLVRFLSLEHFFNFKILICFILEGSVLILISCNLFITTIEVKAAFSEL